jgi:DNA-binding transcriptional LysR family regulator
MKRRWHTRQTTFRQLEILLAVAERRSVTAAAEALHLAQPTVSTQVAKLAEAVGAPLFEQVGRQMHLTEVGEDVVRAARSLFDVLDGLEMRLAQRAGLEVGRLRIAVVTTAKYLIPRWLGSFCAQHPGITPELQIANRGEVIRRLQHNLDDLYVFSHPPYELDIHAEPLTDNPLVMIAPTGHRLAGRRLNWSDLAGERLLMRETGSGTRYAVERFLAQQAWPLPDHVTIASTEAIKEAVAAGLGVGIVSRHALTHMAPGNITELDVAGLPIPNSWYLVTLRGKQLSPAALAFKQHVGEQLAKVPGHGAA